MEYNKYVCMYVLSGIPYFCEAVEIEDSLLSLVALFIFCSVQEPCIFFLLQLLTICKIGRGDLWRIIMNDECISIELREMYLQIMGCNNIYKIIFIIYYDFQLLPMPVNIHFIIIRSKCWKIEK
jgi:hypothetical protein